ncbi:hypothetical protein [Nonomuraea helvata]|uniref:Uncharacterized protein n=1 Tax=Nonomuraea helvata TaxID=37484 RepID=A0ABV5SF95_9ACTN
MVVIVPSLVKRRLGPLGSALVMAAMGVRSETAEQEMERGSDRDHHEERAARAAAPEHDDDHVQQPI